VIWVGHAECMGDGKRLLGRPRSIWEDNIKMALKEVEWEVVDCIYMVQNKDKWRALVNMVMKLWVTKNVENFSIRTLVLWS
jgi:hypothetical protein